MTYPETHGKKSKSRTYLGMVNGEKVNYKTSLTAIRKARRFTVQGLYEWLITGNSAHDIEVRTRSENAMHTVHLAYYHELLHKIINNSKEMIGFIQQQLDRDWSRLDFVEQAVLLIGSYEMRYSLHIPYKVVIDEALQLNSYFGSSDGYKVVHVVMDKIAKQTRQPEIALDAQQTTQKTQADE